MKLRAYCVVNQYICGIHAGIQSAHAIARLSPKYKEGKDLKTKDCRTLLDKWATEDETIIVVDGGYQSRMYDFMNNILKDDRNTYPWAHFNESREALNGALTAIVVILPENVYDVKRNDSGDGWMNVFFDESTLDFYELTPWETKLVEELKSFKLKGA